MTYYAIGINAPIEGAGTQHADDAWIYCNTFRNCPYPIRTTNSDGANLILRMVIARNNFDVAPTNQAELNNYGSAAGAPTMAYDNINYADFNVPATKQITSCAGGTIPALLVTVTANPGAIQAGGTSAVTVHVTDDLGSNVSGAAVTLTASGGLLTNLSGTTNASGNFVTSFTDSIAQTVTINAAASATGYTSGQATPATITVSSTPPVLVTVQGTITDGTNPIAGANVTLNGHSYTTIANGVYTFQNITAKVYQMTVTASGYRTWAYPLDASAGGTVTQNVVLSTSTIPPPINLAGLGLIVLGGAVVIYLVTRKGKKRR
jgi:hypothetical protein